MTVMSKRNNVTIIITNWKIMIVRRCVSISCGFTGLMFLFTIFFGSKQFVFSICLLVYVKKMYFVL